jgi:hypothetical protein
MSSLTSVGFDEQSSRLIIADLLQPDAHIQRLRSGTVSTFAAMKKARFFDNEHNRQLFSQAGFIDG